MIRRIRLLYLVLRRSAFLSVFPVLVAYCFLPFITVARLMNKGDAEALQVFVYASQILLPLCAMLWPMGYLHVWVEGDACEALCSYSTYHKTCIGEMLVLNVIYELMLFPVILFAVFVLDASWLEYFRLMIQVQFILGCFYFAVMAFHNVTIGSIPVIGYLFLCFCISGSAEFSSFSVIEPQHLAEQHNWFTLLLLVPSSIVLFFAGYMIDRYFRKYR